MKTKKKVFEFIQNIHSIEIKTSLSLWVQSPESSFGQELQPWFLKMYYFGFIGALVSVETVEEPVYKMPKPPAHVQLRKACRSQNCRVICYGKYWGGGRLHHYFNAGARGIRVECLKILYL